MYFAYVAYIYIQICETCMYAYCAGHIYTTTFFGEPFFLRNNPRIFDSFDDFYFKTVKIIFFLPQNSVLGTVSQKKIISCGSVESPIIDKKSANRIIFALTLTEISSRKLDTEKSISVSSMLYRNLLPRPSSTQLLKLYCEFRFCKTILVMEIFRSQDVEREFSDPCRKITTHQKKI